MDLLATRKIPRIARVLPSNPCRCWLLLVFLLGVPLRGLAVDVSVETTPTGEVFPTLELSREMPASGAVDADGNGLLRIRLRHAGAPIQVLMQMDTPGLLRPTVIGQRLERESILRPRLAWDASALRQLHAPRAQVLTVSIRAEGMAPIKREFPIRVHPLDEALYFVREAQADVDLGWSFAAWVDPYHPVVDEILQMAGLDLDAGVKAKGGREERLRLARELWVVLERRGLRYASESTGISQGPVMYSQRVRLLSSTWNDRVANCMDGSVLIASVLERLGVDTLIVLVPGHAFVGFYSAADKREAEFLETTLLGQKRAFNPASRDEDERVREQALVGFEAARRAGRTAYRKAAPRLDGRHRPDFALIDISVARAYGIMPLAGEHGRVHEVGITANAPTSPGMRPVDHSP